MKKKSILILIIILLLFLFFTFFYLNSKTSNSEIPNSLNQDIEIPNNIYIKEEMINNANTTLITELYKKGNDIYEHIENDDFTINEDIFWDFESHKEILVDNISKSIDITEISEDTSSSFLKKCFPNFKKILNENKKNYKYYGEENINGKNCVKFSLAEDTNTIAFFYVSTDNNFLYQKEVGQYYKNNFTIYYKYNYTYSLNTVLDVNILKFEENNYTNYTYIN